MGGEGIQEAKNSLVSVGVGEEQHSPVSGVSGWALPAPGLHC